jgi:1-phosphatidylinositol-4-phosphate 5-kinase
MINGNGVYRSVDGSFYEGEWRKGVKHGHGNESWIDGSHYEG